MRAQYYLRLSDLKNYLQKQYDVFFELLQSYYNLFKEAGISWKKSQKKNPANNDELVQAKRKEIEEFLAKLQPEIEPEKLTVFMIHEYHLLWEDILGYAWGKTDQRI